MYFLLFDFIIFLGGIPSQDRYFRGYFLTPRLPGLLWRTEGFAKDVCTTRFLCLDQIRTNFSTVLGIDWLLGIELCALSKRTAPAYRKFFSLWEGSTLLLCLLGCKRMLSPMQPTNTWKCITERSDEKRKLFPFFFFFIIILWLFPLDLWFQRV